MEKKKIIRKLGFTNYNRETNERSQTSIKTLKQRIQKAESLGATHIEYDVRLDGSTVVDVWIEFVKFLNEEEIKQEKRKIIEQEIEYLKQELDNL